MMPCETKQEKKDPSLLRETKLYFFKVFLTNILENETPLLRGFQLLTRAGYPIPVVPGSSFAYPSTGSKTAVLKLK